MVVKYVLYTPSIPPLQFYYFAQYVYIRVYISVAILLRMKKRKLAYAHWRAFAIAHYALDFYNFNNNYYTIHIYILFQIHSRK